MANSNKFLDLDTLAYFKGKNDDTYVAQVSGKGLSTNDFTDAYKNKVDAFGDASTYALKSDIVGVYIYQGSVDNMDALPLADNTKGDVYNVEHRYDLLTEKPSDWNSSYTSYYTKSGSTYSAVTGGTAPAFAADTYYAQYDDGTNYAWKSASATGTAADWDPLGSSFEIAKITTADIDALFT